MRDENQAGHENWNSTHDATPTTGTTTTKPKLPGSGS
jgi:hypothetical protein